MWTGLCHACSYANTGHGIAACNRAVAAQGVSAEDHSRAYYNRALEWAGQGDHGRAIADYNDAIRLNPRYADAYLNRGITHARKGEFGAGIRDLTQVIQLNPRYAEAYYWRSMMAGRKGDNTLAMADFNAAATLDPAKYKNVQERTYATGQTAFPCSSGSIHVARMEPQTSLAGEYRFLIENGQVKALKFTASYCPRAKPASQK